MSSGHLLADSRIGATVADLQPFKLQCRAGTAFGAAQWIFRRTLKSPPSWSARQSCSAGRPDRNSPCLFVNLQILDVSFNQIWNVDVL